MPSLKVKMPNGGEDYPLNETRPITWRSELLTSNIKIILVDKKTNKTFTIEDSHSISPEFAYQWKVGKVKDGGTVPVGHDYAIRVKTLTGHYVDDSDNTFSISAKKILKIINPCQLNVWSLESSRLITWENPGNIPGNCQLLLLAKNSSNGHIIGDHVSINALKYLWNVGNTQDHAHVDPGQYSIVLIAAGNLHAESQLFTISPPATYSITPDIINSYWYSHYRWENPLCGASLDKHGYAPEDADPTTMRVGYQNDYSGNFCLRHYLGHAFRGFLTFDLSQVKGVLVEAKLLLTRQSTTKWQGDTASNVGCCAGSISILDAPFSDFNTPAHLYDQLPQSAGSTTHTQYDGGKNLVIDVTGVVKDWLEGKQPNYGLTFRGCNENYHHDNDRCITIFHPVVLSIKMKPTI